MRTLHQFPISHFCEKTRWNLDAKGLRYATRNILPGLHQIGAPRGARASTLPILVDGDTVVADSTEIAHYLDRTYPGHPLIPHDADARTRALALEDDFDATLGPAVRRFMYGAAMAEKGAVQRLFFRGYGRAARAVGKVVGPLLEVGLRRKYRINPESIERSLGDVHDACDRLERALDGDASRYLVGDALTIADVTAASLLAPMVGPAGSPWEGAELSPRVRDECERVRARVAGRWVAERYARDRRAG